MATTPHTASLTSLRLPFPYDMGLVVAVEPGVNDNVRVLRFATGMGVVESVNHLLHWDARRHCWTPDILCPLRRH